MQNSIAAARAGIITRPKLVFNEGQELAIDSMLHFITTSRAATFCLQGYAGTGKTTSVQEVVRCLPVNKRVVFTAPTNKATRVLREMAAGAGVEPGGVCTTYALLGLRMTKDDSVKLIRQGDTDGTISNYDIVVVDECSMLKQPLLNVLLAAAKRYGVKIIFMGDPLQLPPIGETYSQSFHCEEGAQLVEICRQAEGNPIIAATVELRRCILEGGRPNFVAENVKGVGGLHLLEAGKWMHWIKSGFNSNKYHESPDQFKVIAWRNRTVDFLNDQIRSVLFPDQYDKTKFVVGERVIAKEPITLDDGDGVHVVLATDEEAYVEQVKVMPHPIYKDLFKIYGLELLKDDGELVYSTVIHEDSELDLDKELRRRTQLANKNRQMWGSFWDFKDSFHEISACHALTSHRSQGSTYNNAFIDMSDIMENRNWTEAMKSAYVAVSRASENACIKGM